MSSSVMEAWLWVALGQESFLSSSFDPNAVLMARLRLGRKGPLVWSYLQLAVSGAATAYFSSFGAYCVSRFLMGMTFSGIILNSLSLGESSRGGAGSGARGRRQGSPSSDIVPVSLCGILTR